MVEPIFTLVLLGLVLTSLWRRSTAVLGAATLAIGLFLGCGAIQQSRAREAVRSLHRQRGHQPSQLVVKPTIGNQILWRVCYLHGDRVYTDAVRTGFFSAAKLYPGEVLPLVNLENDFSELKGTRSYRDFERFSQLSQGLLVVKPDNPNVLGDARYAMLPTSLKPLWGLQFDPKNPEHAPGFVTFRDSSRRVREKFWDMLVGREQGILP